MNKMAEIIGCYPLKLKYRNGKGRTAKSRGSYITKCIRNREKRMKAKMDKEIIEIIRLHKAGNDEPLDGDDVDRLVDLIRDKINEIEGNV